MILEVERKFLAVAPAIFMNNSGTPPFSHLTAHRSKTFCDTYYDQGTSLRDVGIYIRKRNSGWEAKIKQAGTYNKSQFIETKDTMQIAKYIREVLRTDNVLSPLTCFGLQPCAKLTTKRLSWTADKAFKIVLDTTDFGHTVGEVELEVAVPDEISLKEKKALMKEMDCRIESFMKTYTVFPQGKPIGKLTAYFAHQKAQEKKALEEILASKG